MNQMKIDDYIKIRQILYITFFTNAQKYCKNNPLKNELVFVDCKTFEINFCLHNRNFKCPDAKSLANIKTFPNQL